LVATDQLSFIASQQPTLPTIHQLLIVMRNGAVALF